MVVATYDGSYNNIEVPAGILQPPFFDIGADPAANYGAIGAIIGHEMTHAFYGDGATVDHAGLQREWWTAEDRTRFEDRSDALIPQYDGYCPLPRQCVNGWRTQFENISDIGGLSIAYRAYRLSLKGKEAPVIDGLTGDQRFFLAWAQAWKSKYRDETMINKLKAGSHAPPKYRINGALRNLDEWYVAFDVKPDDELYLPPEQRVRVW